MRQAATDHTLDRSRAGPATETDYAAVHQPAPMDWNSVAAEGAFQVCMTTKRAGC